MTEHRCNDGTWKPGKTKDCIVCRFRQKPRPVKRTAES